MFKRIYFFSFEVKKLIKNLKVSEIKEKWVNVKAKRVTEIAKVNAKLNLKEIKTKNIKAELKVIIKENTAKLKKDKVKKLWLRLKFNLLFSYLCFAIN